MTVACPAGPRCEDAQLGGGTLSGEGAERDEALADLHDLLLRAARFELGRRRAALSYVRGEELDDLATQAADDALVALLAKLDDFRGASRFTTWAYKFALLEAGVKLPPARLAGPRGGARAGELAVVRRRSGRPRRANARRPSCSARAAARGRATCSRRTSATCSPRSR